MKISEMNSHQKVMFDFVRYEISMIIGGYENTIVDEPEDSEEYKEAKAYLEQSHDDLIEDIYKAVMDDCKANGNASHARFAGGDFLRERIDRRLTKLGY